MLALITTLIVLVSVSTSARIKVERYWQAATGDHFYTTNAAEIGTTKPGQTGNHGYKSEGVGFRLPSPGKDQGSIPLYRYWNGGNTDHFYTTNAAEIGTTTAGQTGHHGYKSEGQLGTCFKDRSARPGLVPLYRYWNSGNGDHFYTLNADEIGTTTAGQTGNHGYKSEGITCYVFPVNDDVFRYWQGSTADHFYTKNAAEIGKTKPGETGNHGYTSEGVGFALPDPDRAQNSIPLYRYWNAGNTDHFYTTNAAEIGTTTPGQTGSHGYKSEGQLGQCFKDRSARAGLVPLYRYWNGGSGDHFYTLNAAEIGTTTAGQTGHHGYTSEGITCYVFAPSRRADTVPFNNFFNLNDGNWVIPGSTVMYIAYVVVGLLFANIVMMVYVNLCKSKSGGKVAYKQVYADSDA